jgi:hypothetical protein
MSIGAHKIETEVPPIAIRWRSQCCHSTNESHKRRGSLCLTLLESSGMMLCTNCELILGQIRGSGTFRGDVSLFGFWTLGQFRAYFSYALGKLIARTGTKRTPRFWPTAHDNAIQP